MLMLMWIIFLFMLETSSHIFLWWGKRIMYYMLMLIPYPGTGSRPSSPQPLLAAQGDLREFLEKRATWRCSGAMRSHEVVIGAGSHGPLKSVIFLSKRPFLRDFPASHVWRGYYILKDYWQTIVGKLLSTSQHCRWDGTVVFLWLNF